METYAGRHFIFCFPSNRGPPSRERSMNIQLQSTSSNQTYVSVVAPGISWSEHLILEPNQTRSIEAPDEVEADRTVTLQKGTIIITSDYDIFVTAVSNTLTSLATFPVIPFESAASEEFFIGSYFPRNFPLPPYPNQIMITAGVNMTNVIIKKTPETSFDDILFLDDFQYFKLNEDELAFIVPSRESLQVRCDVDLTGFQVISDLPVSLISGGECTYVTPELNDCDHIATYVPPVDRLGRQFTIAPFVERDTGYIFRIVAVRDETNVSISSSVSGVFSMNAGQFYEGDVNDTNITFIITNKPVLVVQFAKGFTSDGKYGDPFMMVIPPREQYVNSVSFASFNMSQYEIYNNYLNIITSCDRLSGIIFNGDKFEDITWYDILEELDGEQCVARKEVNVSRVNYITHESPDARFIAFLYGAGQAVSYGHALDHKFTQITCTVPDGVNGTKEVDCDFNEGERSSFTARNYTLISPSKKTKNKTR